MTDSQAQHQYAPGDAVLANMGSAQIPGVVSDVQGDRILIELSQPWVDETGQSASTVALGADAVSPLVGGTGASRPELTG